jgi:hypothetical protein
VKPPIPLKPADHEPDSRRAALAPMAIALLVVLLFAALAFYQDWGKAPPAPSPAATGRQGPYSDMESNFRRGPMNPRRMLESLDADAQSQAGDLLKLRPGDERLDTEPAGLAPFPPDELVRTERLSGLRRRSEWGAEEIVVWELHGVDPGDAIDHYEEQARKMGFTDVRTMGRRPGPAMTRPAAINRVFSRLANAPPVGPEPPHYELLVVRAGPTTDGSRVVLWLRYPIQHAAATTRPGGPPPGADQDR